MNLPASASPLKTYMQRQQVDRLEGDMCWSERL